MSEKKKNPLLLGLVNVIPGIINTIGNLVKDKKRSTGGTTSILPAFAKDCDNPAIEQIANGLQLSSKIVFGYGFGGMIILHSLTQDLSQWQNLVVLGIGALVNVGTSIAKAIDKKS